MDVWSKYSVRICEFLRSVVCNLAAGSVRKNTNAKLKKKITNNNKHNSNKQPRNGYNAGLTSSSSDDPGTEDFHTDSKVRREGVCPLYGALKRRGLTQLS